MKYVLLLFCATLEFYFAQEFDFIIVGAGLSGCVISRKLFDAGFRVLVLEAGYYFIFFSRYEIRRFNQKFIILPDLGETSHSELDGFHDAFPQVYNSQLNGNWTVWDVAGMSGKRTTIKYTKYG